MRRDWTAATTSQHLRTPNRTDSPLPPTTRVVDIKTGATFTVYIGRYHQGSRYGILPRSKWANPFRVGKEAVDADDAVAQYRVWLQTQPRLLSDAPMLRGQVLGCWCAPGPCHGDVLAGLANGHDDEMTGGQLTSSRRENDT
jgi:Domain of unknown function (DUF4326)